MLRVSVYYTQVKLTLGVVALKLTLNLRCFRLVASIRQFVRTPRLVLGGGVRPQGIINLRILVYLVIYDSG